MPLILRQNLNRSLTWEEMDGNLQLLYSGSILNTGSFSGDITGSLFGTASYAIQSLSSSYALTASFTTQTLSSSYALTASYAMNGGGGSTSTSSLLVTASANLNTITFTKGDGTTFPITVNTGSGGGGVSFPYNGNVTITGSLLISGSGITTKYSGLSTPSNFLTSSSPVVFTSNNARRLPLTLWQASDGGPSVLLGSYSNDQATLSVNAQGNDFVIENVSGSVIINGYNASNGGYSIIEAGDDTVTLQAAGLTSQGIVINADSASFNPNAPGGPLMLKFNNLPTSPVGLSAGSVWNSGSFLKIV